MPHKLLLADDSVTIQRVIELTFADEDVTVIAVGDGKQAIEQALAERPDIILADIGMPERDGYDVAAYIKNTPELAHIPVLLLTGAFEPIDEGRARAARCDGVLVKPFEPQMVINRVKDLIAGKRPSAPGHTPPAIPVPTAAAPAPAGDYLDRLDAAFAAKDGAPEARRVADATPPAAGLADEFANWSTDLAPPDAGAAPSPRNEAAPPAEAAGPPRHPSPAPPVPAPSLADAFAALLAAEQGRAFAPAPISRAMVSDEMMEELTRRVIERLGAQSVRDVVLEVAERLVREEIERIKSG